MHTVPFATFYFSKHPQPSWTSRRRLVASPMCASSRRICLRRESLATPMAPVQNMVRGLHLDGFGGNHQARCLLTLYPLVCTFESRASRRRTAGNALSVIGPISAFPTVSPPFRPSAHGVQSQLLCRRMARLHQYTDDIQDAEGSHASRPSLPASPSRHGTRTINGILLPSPCVAILIRTTHR